MPITLPAVSSPLIRPIKQGMMINSVHHPLKNKLILSIPEALSPHIIPTIMRTIPQIVLLEFFICSST
jgi:hypothetical protein